MKIRVLLLLAAIVSTNLPLAQVKNTSAFKILPLGVLGGGDESNLSAYMVAPSGSNNYVCLDAGTLRAGLEKAVAGKVFNTSAEQVLKQNIKGYCISHSHLDHLAGLIISSPDDTAKQIYALQGCIDVFKANYFTWKSWANFANEGDKPALGKYQYTTLMPGNTVGVQNTELEVTPYPLSHSNLTSTAFLLKHNKSYLLYLGDTGADSIEKSQNLEKLWLTVAPLIKSRQLKGIMIEVSFPNQQPNRSLFGHLTPRLLIQELKVLEKYAGSLKGLNIVVTHLKPPTANISQIKAQLKTANTLGVNLIFPAQAKLIML